MKNILKISAIASMMFAVSCTSSFEEVNTNPDAYSKAPHTNVLGNVIRKTASEFGGDLDVSTWAGYVVKIQYLDNYAGYLPTNNTYGNRWYQCYWGYVQLQGILDNTEAVAEENKNMRNVCLLLQNYLMSLCTDCFGDIPYSEAFKGAPENGYVLQTPYDKQADIYPKILANLKTVADSWAESAGSDKLGNGDFLFDENIEKWQKFCNSLRLRIAMRISAVYPESKSTIEEIFNNPAKYPYITECADNAYFIWQGSGKYFDRYYDDFRSRDEHGMSEIFIDHLKKMDDPRLPILAKKASIDNEYHGYENGALNQPQGTAVSRIGTLYREDPVGFTPFYRACESYFMMAEAALSGWNVPMSAAEAYEEGVRLSMEDNGIKGVEVDTYLAGKGKWDGTKDRLYSEQWVALFKECIEAWAFYRRTGYPTYIQTAVAADGVTGQYPGAKSVWGKDHNDVPFRMPYPDNQYQYNKEYVTAAAANVADHCWGEQMWWDKRTGVK